MPIYNAPLRDMQFVMHEVLNVTEELKPIAKYADADIDTINAVLEEGAKFEIGRASCRERVLNLV